MTFEEGVALQNELGVPSRLLDARGSRGALAARRPRRRARGDVLPTRRPREPRGGRPGLRLRRAATRCDRPHTLRGDGDRRVGRRRSEASTTERGRIETGTVVCAAGAWSPAVARLVGVELPVEPVLREVGYTAPIDGLPDRIPLTIDFSTGFYFHREGPGLLFGLADPDQAARLRRAHGPVVARAGHGGRRAAAARPSWTWASQAGGRATTR